MKKRTGKGRNPERPSARNDGLYQSEQRYRLLLDAVQEGIWAADTEGVTTYVNPRMCEMLGHPMEEVVGRSVFDFVDASDLDAAWAHHQRGLRNSGERFQFKLVRKDGTRCWAQFSSSPLPELDGKVTAVIAAVTDISGRKLAEDAHRLLVNSSIQGLGILQHGRVVFCNDALASISGYSSDELLRMGPEEVAAVVHPDDRPRVLAAMRDRMDGRALEPTQLFRFIDKEGRSHWVETTSARTDFNGSPALLVTYTEVTKRHEAENALRESEAKLRRLIEQNILGIVLVDENGRIAEWNARMADITGMDSSIVCGQGLEVLRVLMPAGPAHLEEAFSRLAGSGREAGADGASAPFTGTHKAKIRLSGGEEKVLKVGVFPIRLSKGFMLAALVEDVTEQERIWDAYRSLVDNSIQAFGIIQDGAIVFCNEALGRMSGYSQEETYRMTAEEVAATVHPEDRGRVAIAMQALFEGGESLPGQQVRLLNRQGQVRWVELLAARVIFNSRPALQISYMDVTARREAEAALRESEERFRAFIENAPVAIGVSRQGKIVYGNRAYLRMFGILSLQAVFGRPLTDQVAPQFRQVVAERAMNESRGEPAEEEYQMMAIRLDGLQFPCRLAITGLVLSDGPATLAFFFDLTEQKESEKRLEDSRGKIRNLAVHLLHAREEERKTVAREIHDELGQILTALKMDLQWIEKRLAPRTAQVMEKIHGVVGLADQAIQIVHRISSELRPGILDDLGLAAAIEWLGGDFSRRNGVPCRVDITVPESRIGGNGSTALFRIVQEALSNIARHAHATHVSVEIWEADRTLTIRVQDDGSGLTEEQSASPLSFGLIGIRERVQALGGEMSITGRSKEGTILLVTIPLPEAGALA